MCGDLSKVTQVEMKSGLGVRTPGLSLFRLCLFILLALRILLAPA